MSVCVHGKYSLYLEVDDATCCYSWLPCITNPAPAAVNVVEDDSVSDDFDLDNMLDDDSDSVSDEFDLDNMLDDDSDYEC